MNHAHYQENQGLPLISGMEHDEQYLARRFAAPVRRAAETVYEFTRDLGLIFQYRRLRDELFVGNDAGRTDEFDDRSEVLVMRRGNHCLGGCRLTVATPGSNARLPMEQGGFVLQDTISGLADQAYMEVSMMALLPEFDTQETVAELCQRIVERAAEQQVRYVFAAVAAPLARRYRAAARAMGMEWDVLANVTLPEREEYSGNLMLSALQLMPASRPQKTRRAKTRNAELVA